MAIQFDPNVVCSCGKVHKTMVEHRLVKNGAINEIPEYVKMYGAKKAFIVSKGKEIRPRKACKAS